MLAIAIDGEEVTSTMSKILKGYADHPVWKRFIVNETKPAVKVDWGFYFDGVVGGEYAEMFIFIYSADWNTILATGYKLHNSGPAGIFTETDTLYRGSPEYNAGDNHSNYGGVPFEEGQEIIVYFRAAKEIWSQYKFGVNWVEVEMSD